MIERAIAADVSFTWVTESTYADGRFVEEWAGVLICLCCVASSTRNCSLKKSSVIQNTSKIGSSRGAGDVVGVFDASTPPAGTRCSRSASTAYSRPLQHARCSPVRSKQCFGVGTVWKRFRRQGSESDQQSRGLVGPSAGAQFRLNVFTCA